MTSLMVRLRLVLLAAAFALAAVASSAQAAPSKREMEAREAYAAGRYQQALDLFARLYAETLHPTYLRNIGRCHQNLGQPDPAIASFREYLRKARGLTPDERAEVEGYIREMEALKKAAAPLPEVKSAPPPIATPPPAPAIEAPATLVQSAPPPAPVEATPPLYRRGWFWVVVGGVVLAGVAGGLVAAGAFSSKDPGCPGTFVCK